MKGRGRDSPGFKVFSSAQRKGGEIFLVGAQASVARALGWPLRTHTLHTLRPVTAGARQAKLRLTEP